MNPILYWIPNAPEKIVAEKSLRAAGLEHLLPGHSQSLEYATGPDGQSGVLFTWMPDGVNHEGPMATYNAETQEWVRCAGGKWWCGYYKDRKPGPADLARAEQYDSHLVTLEDGNEWAVPLARFLPRLMSLDDDGNPSYKSLGRFDAYCRYGQKLYESIQAKGMDAASLTESEWYGLVSEGLGLNYRVGRWEIFALLRLVSTAHKERFGWAALDQESFDAVIAAMANAKNAGCPADTPDGTSTGSGAQGA